MDAVRSRGYSSPLREARAAANRASILRAAGALFLERGFDATTLEDIAAAAGVSKPTVFTSVGNKAQVLKVVRDVAMAGDDEPVPVMRRPTFQRIRTAQDLPSAIRAISAHLVLVCSRSAGIQEVLRGAASRDPAIRELWETSERERLVAARALLGLLAGHRAPLLSKARAADVLWLLMAPDHYQRLVVERGWSERAYRRWLETSMLALFAPA